MNTQLFYCALIFFLVSQQAQAQIQILNTSAGLPAEGSLATIFCTGLTGIEGLIVAETYPLPTTLAGVGINYGAVDAPLLTVKDVRAGGQAYQQINFQVPFGRTAPPRLIQGAQSAELPFPQAPWGQLYGTAQHGADYRPVSILDPPKAGERIILYGTNFGEVTQRQQSGHSAPIDQLVGLSTLLVGLDLWKFRVVLEAVSSEQQLDLEFAGLAPGTVGIYQFNFRMPDTLPVGPAWVVIKRVANCGDRFSPGCGTGLRVDSTEHVRLY